jgi:hypothetical protein
VTAGGGGERIQEQCRVSPDSMAHAKPGAWSFIHTSYPHASTLAALVL